MKIKNAELHAPLFLRGHNLTNKLDSTRGKVQMLYSREHKELLVLFQHEVAIIPTSGIISMVPFDQTESNLFELQPQTMKLVDTNAASSVSAQASDPVADVVFKEDKRPSQRNQFYKVGKKDGQ